MITAPLRHRKPHLLCFVSSSDLAIYDRFLSLFIRDGPPSSSRPPFTVRLIPMPKARSLFFFQTTFLLFFPLCVENFLARRSRFLYLARMHACKRPCCMAFRTVIAILPLRRSLFFPPFQNRGRASMSFFPLAEGGRVPSYLPQPSRICALTELLPPAPPADGVCMGGPFLLQDQPAFPATPPSFPLGPCLLGAPCLRVQESVFLAPPP